MRGKGILIILGIFLIFLKIKEIFIVHNGWIIGCFILWLILFYISEHKKNLERRTPRPVYMTN